MANGPGLLCYDVGISFAYLELLIAGCATLTVDFGFLGGGKVHERGERRLSSLQ